MEQPVQGRASDHGFRRKTKKRKAKHSGTDMIAVMRNRYLAELDLWSGLPLTGQDAADRAGIETKNERPPIARILNLGDPVFDPTQAQVLRVLHAAQSAN